MYNNKLLLIFRQVNNGSADELRGVNNVLELCEQMTA